MISSAEPVGPLVDVLEAAKAAREGSVRAAQAEADEVFVAIVRRTMDEERIGVTEAAARAGMSRTNLHLLLSKFPEKS